MVTKPGIALRYFLASMRSGVNAREPIYDPTEEGIAEIMEAADAALNRPRWPHTTLSAWRIAEMARADHHPINEVEAAVLMLGDTMYERDQLATAVMGCAHLLDVTPPAELATHLGLSVDEVEILLACMGIEPAHAQEPTDAPEQEPDADARAALGAALVDVLSEHATTLAEPPVEAPAEEPAPLASPIRGDEADWHWATDGRVVDDQLFRREILHHAGEMVRSAYEAGRRLAAVKAALPHGAFGRWIRENMPFKSGHAQKLMRLATWIRGREHLLQPLQGAPLRKVLLLTSLPAKEADELLENATLNGVPMPELGSVPYAELAEQLREMRGKLGARELDVELEKNLKLRAENDAAAARAETEAVKARLAEVAGVAPAGDPAKIIRRIHNAVDAMWVEILPDLTALLSSAGSLSRQELGELHGLVEYIQARARLEHLHQRTALGDTPTHFEWDQALGERPASNVFVFPPARLPQVVGE